MATLSPFPIFRFFDASGNPLAGGKLYTYEAGTTTPLATYTDAGAGTPNANPIILDANGECAVPYLQNVPYKFNLISSSGLQQPGWPQDNISNASDIALNAFVALLAGNTGSQQIGHLPSGSGAVKTTVYQKFENDTVSIFDFMTEVQRNDVQGYIGSVDVSSAIQKAHDKAAGRIITGWGKCKITHQIDATSSMVGIGGGIFEGQGLEFFYTGAANKIFNFASYESGMRFENFRTNSNTITSDCTHMYFEQGIVGAKFSMVENRGYFSAPNGWIGTYANQDGIILYTDGIVGNATQNTFDQVYFSRLRRGFTAIDAGGIGDGGGNIFTNGFGWCKEYCIKSAGPSLLIKGGDYNCSTGGFNFIQTGSFAAGWSYEGVQATQEMNSDYIIRGDTAGSFNLFNWTGGNIASNEGGGARLLSSAGNGTHVFRYTISGETSSTGPAVQSDNFYAGQGFYSQNRNTADGVWTTPTFAAGDYTGQGSMTVTVISTNVDDFKYTFFGKTMVVKFSVANITIGGTPAPAIRINIPAGVSVASYGSNPVTIKDNGTWGIGSAEVVAGQPYIYIFKDAAGSNWSLATTNTSFKGELSFETT